MSFLFAANWKMNHNPLDAQDFFKNYIKLKANDNFKSLFFIPAVTATTVADCLQGSEIFWGPQNIYPAANGAFTGENSPKVFSALGAKYVLIGHSERRQIFKETDDFLNQKMQAANEFNLNPILCIGETLEERKAGKTLEVVEHQLDSGLKDYSIQEEMHIAYEPVWAIGTGEVATVAQVDEVHQFIRHKLNRIYPGNKSQILYGGSVKGSNARELSQVGEVGGFLVGGASLKPDTFMDIVKAV